MRGRVEAWGEGPCGGPAPLRGAGPALLPTPSTSQATARGALQGRRRSGGEAEPAALHADLQAVGGLAAGVHDTAVQVAGQVAVGALARAAAAAAEARVLGAAGAACGAVQDDVAQRQELAEQAGQDAVDAAVCGHRRGTGLVREPGGRGTQPQRAPA